MRYFNCGDRVINRRTLRYGIIQVEGGEDEEEWIYWLPTATRKGFKTPSGAYGICLYTPGLIEEIIEKRIARQDPHVGFETCEKVDELIMKLYWEYEASEETKQQKRDDEFDALDLERSRHQLSHQPYYDNVWGGG